MIRQRTTSKCHLRTKKKWENKFPLEQLTENTVDNWTIHRSNKIEVNKAPHFLIRDPKKPIDLNSMNGTTSQNQSFTLNHSSVNPRFEYQNLTKDKHGKD